MAAFAVDGLVLGVVGQALAWPLSPFWFRIGPYGRFVGQFIALVYFGVMDSRYGGGQSMGKRLLGIAIRDRRNESISVTRSMLRTLIWLAPVTLNGWALPLLRTPILAWFTEVILFGVGGAILFTMVFNRRTRQGLHDMLCDTYVVRADGEPIEVFPTVARLQWIATGIMVAVALVLATVSAFGGPIFGAPLQQVIRLQREIEPDRRFFSVSIFDRTFHVSGGKATRTLVIEAWYRGVPTEPDRQKAMNDVAKAALDQMDSIGDFDLMRITMTSAYDLGIASYRSAYGDGQPIKTWRQRTAAVSKSNAPN
jgi:uncharacterized RDD family membrane protein YckC